MTGGNATQRRGTTEGGTGWSDTPTPPHEAGPAMAYSLISTIFQPEIFEKNVELHGKI